MFLALTQIFDIPMQSQLLIRVTKMFHDIHVEHCQFLALQVSKSNVFSKSAALYIILLLLLFLSSADALSQGDWKDEWVLLAS